MIDQIIQNFRDYEEKLKGFGTAGYTVALNIWNVTPEFYHTTLPEAWVEEYTGENYAYIDPVMQFTATRTGMKRWSEIIGLRMPWNDSVFEKAKNYNLNFGAAVVKKSKVAKRKHLLTVGRSDRELSDQEMLELSSVFESILAELHPKDHLTERQLKILTCHARGLTGAQTANEVGISVETVKRDLAAATAALGVRNTTAAVAAAVSRKLIFMFDGPKY